jgi:hypothetical protein
MVVAFAALVMVNAARNIGRIYLAVIVAPSSLW